MSIAPLRLLKFVTHQWQTVREIEACMLCHRWLEKRLNSHYQHCKHPWHRWSRNNLWPSNIVSWFRRCFYAPEKNKMLRLFCGMISGSPVVNGNSGARKNSEKNWFWEGSNLCLPACAAVSQASEPLDHRPDGVALCKLCILYLTLYSALNLFPFIPRCQHRSKNPKGTPTD